MASYSAKRDDHSRYVGRIGALAVAMGIGAAVTATPGWALAEDADGTSAAGPTAPGSDPATADPAPAGTNTATATSGSDGSGDPVTTSKHRSKPGKLSRSERAAAKAAAAKDADAAEAASDAAGQPEDPATEAATTETPATVTEATVGGKHRRAEKSTHADKAVSRSAAAASVADPSQAPSEPDTTAPTPTVATVSIEAVASTAAAEIAAAEAVSPDEEKPSPVERLVSGVLTAVGLDTGALTVDARKSAGDATPVAPLPSSTVAGVLALISRELEYTLFNHKPTLSYDASLNEQTAAGQVTGALGGADADGDALTYTVLKAPKNGSVSVAADGTFTYTPSAGLAAAGGTDTFTVKASDVPGNPFHIHGFALFNGSATAEVTVAVTATMAVSPLGTADQIAAEKLATKIVNSPIIQLAKIVLKLAWKAAAVKQFALVGGPDAANLAQLDRAVDEYALQAALELQLLNSNDPHVLQQVMPPHTWFGETFGGARILYDNPDTIYRMIPVNNASSYVLTGRFDGPLPADTTFSVLTGLTGTTTSVLSGRDLVYNTDGTFTITVDATPADGRPNHLQLTTGATLITARNTLSDWNTQVPMSLTVERVSGPANNLFSQLGLYAFPGIGSLFSSNPIISKLAQLVPALKNPPLLLQAAETAIVMALGLSMEPQYMAVATTDPDTGELRQPNTLSDPAHNASFLATQLQSAGYFQLAEDQALVITINPGSAKYFSVPVTNVWTITDNYWDQQTSLNIAQSVENPDGTYTLVVSPTDPGVANWVSTGGLNLGTLSIRFQDLGSGAAPTISSKVVSLGELDSVLPSTTLYVTPAQRAAQIAARQAGYDNRYAPYSQT